MAGSHLPTPDLFTDKTCKRAVRSDTLCVKLSGTSRSPASAPDSHPCVWEIAWSATIISTSPLSLGHPFQAMSLLRPVHLPWVTGWSWALLSQWVSCLFRVTNYPANWWWDEDGNSINSVQWSAGCCSYSGLNLLSQPSFQVGRRRLRGGRCPSAGSPLSCVRRSGLLSGYAWFPRTGPRTTSLKDQLVNFLFSLTKINSKYIYLKKNLFFSDGLLQKA